MSSILPSEAEKAANAALQAEEERLSEKRKQLASLRRELRQQEEEALATAKVDLMEHHVKQRSAELDRLHHQLHARVCLFALDLRCAQFVSLFLETPVLLKMFLYRLSSQVLIEKALMKRYMSNLAGYVFRNRSWNNASGSTVLRN